jgi:hypothetical protein
VRRLSGILVVALLAIPASAALPSTRVTAGESCKMACDHGLGAACCCAQGKASSSFRRCAPDDGSFASTPFSRLLLPLVPASAAPAVSGWVALLLALSLLRGSPRRPEPVPRLLS